MRKAARSYPKTVIASPPQAGAAISDVRMPRTSSSNTNSQCLLCGFRIASSLVALCVLAACSTNGNKAVEPGAFGHPGEPGESTPARQDGPTCRGGTGFQPVSENPSTSRNEAPDTPGHVVAQASCLHPGDDAQPATAPDAWADDEFLAGLEEEFEEEAGGVAGKKRRDPLKPWNVVWFHFNDKLYFWALRPAAIGYGKVMPKPFRRGIDNFLANVATPVRMSSCLFQGRFKDLGVVAARFGVNTTIGFFGFFDTATDCGFEKRNEDMDQAFARWGIPPGCYIVWPFAGPSSLRGTAGLAGDRLFSPTTWIPWHWGISVGVNAGGTLNGTSLDPDQYKRLKEMTVSPYIGIREAYYQHRQKLVEE